MTIERNFDENILHRKFDLKKSKNWDFISLLLLLFGIILIIIGFWETETILWNRIKYGTGSGSLWINAAPIYLDTSISEIISLYKNLLDASNIETSSDPRGATESNMISFASSNDTVKSFLFIFKNPLIFTYRDLVRHHIWI